ncbi:hypothetical protein K435DRAFT_124880 [Dendrothele bispora CBS 962.96]|uniref:Uncharacterized protein n=1 Tax=Dendrothele bispora (strain CBS 962.96) TaxID=1314807 RepID=A0A4S8M0I7_DENBC|nr:hypothetical protein K435DRAFT_124880 [Dendrothele bispora CBS 962.96]
MSTVWKVVDDKDSRIEYSGQWTSVTGDTKLSDGSDTLDGLSRSGSVFGNTVHGTRTNGTGVTFRFNGTSLAAVYASVAFDSFVGQGDQVVMIDCFLDGKEATGSGYIPSSVPRPINNQPACSVYADSYKGTLSPGEHELSLNVTRISNASFYVDYVVYEALADAPIDGEILRIGDGQMNMRSSPDPHLSFGAGWETGNGGMVSTVTPGSSVTVRFNGPSLLFNRGKGTRIHSFVLF